LPHPLHEEAALKLRLGGTHAELRRTLE